MDENGLQYTLGAGTLLGAMRNAPPGLLQWEHDVDVYVLARQASLLLRKLQARYPLPALPRCALPCPAALCPACPAPLRPLPRHAAHLERSAPNGAPSPHTRRSAACRPLLSLARGLRCAPTPAHRLRRARQADCSPAGWRSRYCSTLRLEGLVDREGRPCCGFGFKIFHRCSRACELDVLVLGR